MTLGRRLTLLSAIAVGATVVLACLGAYLATRSELRGQIDDSLRAQAHAVQVRAGLRVRRRAAACRASRARRAGLAQGFVQLVRPDGTTLRLRGDLRVPVSAGRRGGRGRRRLDARRCRTVEATGCTCAS